MKGTRGNPGLRGKLLERSVDAYVLSLEIINKISVKYRIEAFSYLICNAWELLLKAKILQDTRKRESILYPKEKDPTRRSLALRDCLKIVFDNEKDPTRRNLERLVDLRDQAVHLVIGQVPRDILALFQAGVLNYHRRLTEWFGISLSERVPVGMMAIVFDLDPRQFDFQNPLLRRQLGVETADYLAKLQAEIHDEFAQLGKPAEFSIDIQYKLALVKKLEDCDILLSAGSDGTITRIVEVGKDASTVYPYLQSDLINEFNLLMNGRTRINSYDLQSVIRVYGIKKRNGFFYQGKVRNSPGQYSHTFLEWLITQYTRNDQFFTQTRRTRSIESVPVGSARESPLVITGVKERIVAG